MNAKNLCPPRGAELYPTECVARQIVAVRTANPDSHCWDCPAATTLQAKHNKPKAPVHDLAKARLEKVGGRGGRATEMPNLNRLRSPLRGQIRTEAGRPAGAISRLGVRQSASQRVKITTGDLIRMAAELWGVSVKGIRGKTRRAKVVAARHAVCAVAYDVLGKSYASIGYAMGRNHSAALRGADNARRGFKHRIDRELYAELEAAARAARGE